MLQEQKSKKELLTSFRVGKHTKKRQKKLDNALKNLKVRLLIFVRDVVMSSFAIEKKK